MYTANRKSHRKSAGFTLIETMVTLSVAAILTSVAVPNMSTFSKNSRLTTSSNDMLRSFQLARTESIKRQRNVVVCATSDGATCSYGDFTAWIVFEDSDADWQRSPASEPMIHKHDALDSSLKVSTDNDGIVSFGASGFGMPPGASGKIPLRMIGICDDRGNQAAGAAESTARAVMVDTTGRAHVSRKASDVTAAGNCC